MFVLALQTEIFDTGYCWIVHLSFLTSRNLLFFRFCNTSTKTTFSVFLSFFLVKLPKSQSLKLNISRTAWPILMILVSFSRILNGLSDEINLFWRCSSPLTELVIWIKIKEGNYPQILRQILSLKYKSNDRCSQVKCNSQLETFLKSVSQFWRPIPLLNIARASKLDYMVHYAVLRSAFDQ